jgi:hypothetical protein
MFDTTPFDLLEPGLSGPGPDPVSDELIADLEWLPTGVMLTAVLDRVDRERLSGHDRVSLLKARARQIAHLQAELLADINSVGEAISGLVADRTDDPFIPIERFRRRPVKCRRLSP